MTSVAELSKLQELNLDELRIDGSGFTHLVRCRDLQSIFLRRTQITDETLARLAELPKLRVLDLRRTGIGDSGLAHLKGKQSLGSLTLDGTRITARSLPVLFSLTGLDLLSLRDVSGLTDEDCRRIEQELDECTVLY